MSSELTEVELTGDAFREASSKRVTLLGMSGVGKTRLANVLRDQEWFHYSVDYRIGTRYLSEPILDNIKREAMSVPFLRKLLRTDSIYISNNITFDNLKPLSTFLGMLGNPEQGGIALSEFKRRQALHLEAEIGATLDVSDFINKAVDIYGYPHFLNDASGSFCEIDDESVFEAVARDTVIIYIEASPSLPTFERLSREGQRLLTPERAVKQDVRPLHVGLLNMMPDAALEATERQFFRLLGSSNPISQFYVHPFTLDALPRGAAAREHVSRYYTSFDQVRQEGLDALIISGANVTQPDLAQEVFWEPLAEVMTWADENVTSTLCSCLATHAVLLARHALQRQPLEDKRWGVFDHEVTAREQ